MKFTTITFAVLLVGINALPQDEITLSRGQERLVTSNIKQAVEQMNQLIREAGLDPLHVDHGSTQVITPIGRFGVWIDQLWCSGLSQNRFDRLNYAVFTSRLTVDFVWPRITCETRSAGVQVSILGREFTALQSGGIEIIELRVKGDLRFSIFGGVSLRDCNLDLTADIKSDLGIKIQDRDFSDQVNKAVADLNVLLRANKDAIGEQLCDLAGSLL